jgi:hypothetical protein
MLIIFDGIKHKNNVHYIVFKNEKNERVEIPLDKLLVDHISLHLQKIAPPPPKPVERGNDEE